jgi:protein involved in polysaccharide export with SLBB domain
MRMNRWLFSGALLVLLVLLVGGCATSGTDDQRLARYRPDGAQRRPWEWGPKATVPAVPVAAVGATATNVAVSPVAAAPVDPIPNSYGEEGAVLRRGDSIIVYLKNIPRPEDIQEEVDAVGYVTLPHIGKIHVAGMSTSRAEDAIKAAYISGGYYKRIDVIVVAEAGTYYVRGEVKRPGGFLVSGALTLVQAITSAGGYTDFAKPSKIKLIRDRQDMIFNGDRIEDGKDPDPLIKAKDTIIVPRRRF